MSDEPKVDVYPQGLDDEFPDGPPTAVIAHRGARIVLRFAAGDLTGDGDPEELRLLPDAGRLEPRVLQRFAPNAHVYLQYARAAMRWFDPADPPEVRQQKLRESAQALRKIAGPGRRLTETFYRTIAQKYEAYVAAGEPHPITRIGEEFDVGISGASRWVTEAERLGFVKKEARSRAR